MPQSTVRMPRTINAAGRQLNDLGNLATATEWHRAAIVATFVDPDIGRGHRSDLAGIREVESATTFAARGFVGLTHHETVLVYARAWLSRFERPRAGTSIELPTDGWPPTSPETVARTIVDPDRRTRLTNAATAAGVGVSKVLDVASNPNAVAVALATDATFAANVERNLGERRVPLPAGVTRVVRDRHGLGDRETIDAGALDATQSVDYRLTSAMRTLHESIVGLEMALRPFADRQLVPDVIERIRAEHDALGMLLALAGGVPSDASEVAP